MCSEEVLDIMESTCDGYDGDKEEGKPISEGPLFDEGQDLDDGAQVRDSLIRQAPRSEVSDCMASHESRGPCN
ncbi:hypothetical protein AMTR_s00096p00115720 [Amborella trichopoda]|uniref:Uncharacterized protein n=1 Tax=Amborella trichopoda TaxID=13333 RepID=W1P613_AMBTC|nr:hypothetical protein AMTR_s00096p00115720 [Amborella trichopoda]